ncbi:MAG: nitroreductase [Parahaliea sp.]
MSDLLQALQQRNSAPRLEEPGPSEAQLHEIITAAMRVPDHARMRPWRFIAISGERRQALGELYEQALLKRNPQADEAERHKALKAPLRAPLVIVVIARLTEHPKVPLLEQRLSAACAAHAILLASDALGYAGVWRTGDFAVDEKILDGLGLDHNSEEITGFIYLGTRSGQARMLPGLQVDDFLSHW